MTRSISKEASVSTDSACIRSLQREELERLNEIIEPETYKYLRLPDNTVMFGQRDDIKHSELCLKAEIDQSMARDAGMFYVDFNQVCIFGNSQAIRTEDGQHLGDDPVAKKETLDVFQEIAGDGFKVKIY